MNQDTSDGHGKVLWKNVDFIKSRILENFTSKISQTKTQSLYCPPLKLRVGIYDKIPKNLN
jgi:hypothetical protein